MGMELAALISKLEGESFYPPLFEAAFGTTEITEETLVTLRQAGQGGGRVKVVGWDVTETAEEDLTTGDLQALIVQDPLQMGYLAVLGIVGHLSGNTLDREVDTGAFLVTKASLLNRRIQELLKPPVEELLKGVPR